MGIPALRIMADDAAFLAGRKIDQSLHGRILTERAIVRKTCETLIAAGFTLRLNDGEDWSTPRDATALQVMQECMATDDEYLHAFELDKVLGATHHIGWVRFVYGNDGYDVIADYLTSLEETLKPVEAFAETLESGAIFMWPGDLPRPTAQPIAGAALDDAKRFAAGFAQAEFAPIPEPSNLPLWAVEHPAMYEAQKGELGITLPAGWTDCSWHNDTAPRFEWSLNGKAKLQLFVDCADTAERDDGCGQFILYELDEDGASDTPTLETDDAQAMLAKLAELQSALIAKGA